MHWLVGNMRHDPWCRERNVQHARRMQQARWKMQHANRMVYAQQMVLATPVPPACTPVIGCAVEVARGVHLQAPAHAAGGWPAYFRRTACPCRLPWRLGLLPQITIMLTNERCPSATEQNGGVLAAPVSAATARCAKTGPCAMSSSITAVESMVPADRSASQDRDGQPGWRRRKAMAKSRRGQPQHLR